MSLQVWLPLTKDLRQQGLSNVTVTNNGTTYSSTGGKLGGCYIFDGVDDAITVGNLSTLVTDNFSFACWFYHNDTWSSKNYETIFGGPSGFELEAKSGSTNSPVIRAYSWGQGTFTYELNKWNHLVMTRTTSETKFYLNGKLKLTGTAGTIPSGNYFVGSWSSTTGQNFKGKVNDVRIYDHCLSQMEVKEISKGLVLHYPLSRNGLGQENLLKNSGDLTLWNKESGINCEYDSTVNMYKIYSTTRESSRWGIYQDYAVTVSTDTNYTFSLTGKTDGYSAYLSFGAGTSWPTNYIAFTNNKQRLSKTLTIPAGTTNIRVYLAMYPQTGGGHVYFEKPKLEEGSTSTPWCPNSSDALATTMGLNSNIEYDTSGYCNNGTWHGTHTNTSDTPKYAVSTTATGSASTYLEGPILPAEAQTAALWIKCKKSQNAAIFNDKTSGLQIGLLNSLLYMNSKTSTAGFTTTHWKDDDWNHVVVTYDGTTRKAYINGEAESQSGGSNYYIHNADNCWLWNRSYNNGYPFNGSLSDFRIYATALSASDVKSLYQNCATIDPDGTIRGQIR